MGAVTDWRTNDELIAEQLRFDAEFRREWERTSVGRAVAIALVRYRAEHGLSQRDLAGRLRMTLAEIARLELGEINPSRDVLVRVSSVLAIELFIDAR